MVILSEIVKKNNPSNFIKYRTVREIRQGDYAGVPDSRTQISGAAAQKNVNTGANKTAGNAAVQNRNIDPGFQAFLQNFAANAAKNKPVNAPFVNANSNKSASVAANTPAGAPVMPVNAPAYAQVPQKQKGSGAVFGIVFGIFALLFIVIFAVLAFWDRTDADKFESAVKYQKLTYEMCSEDDGKFYNYIRSDEGHNAVEGFLNGYYSRYDLMSAVWLSAMLPSDYSVSLSGDYLFWFYTETILLGKELESDSETERIFDVDGYTVICELDSDKRINCVNVMSGSQALQAQQYS